MVRLNKFKKRLSRSRRRLKLITLALKKTVLFVIILWSSPVACPVITDSVFNAFARVCSVQNFSVPSTEFLSQKTGMFGLILDSSAF